MSRPLTTSDLIFPSQSHSFSTTLHSLKRSALSIHNRLSSISQDSEYILSISEAYHLPLVANERCGSWYIPLEKKSSSAYFKSTDGHMNEWCFNLRRLNLQILEPIATNGGCVIVDSTRRGKSMPDALSKTIPIWCCVLNRAIFPALGHHPLYTPGHAVSPSEHAQIEQRIDGFVRQFLEICKPDIETLSKTLKKPLRPIWVTQQSNLPERAPPESKEYNLVVLCTASRRVHGGEVSEGGYIQGAADDHEGWACGLTPIVFWKNRGKLLSTNEEELPDLIAELIKEEKGPDAVPILIPPTSNISVSSTANLDIEPFDIVISCTPEPLTTTNPEHLKKKYLHLTCGMGKLGSRDLRSQLPRLRDFFGALPTQLQSILICCPTGKDLSVGVALAILCLYANDKGDISPHPTGWKIDKTFIKKRLAWITTCSPILNPSRETLKAMNAFLMPDPSATSRAAQVDAPASKLVLIKVSTEVQALENTSVHGKQKAEVKSSPSPTLFANLLNNQKPWIFTRTLTSALPTHPSGTVHGTAIFTPYITDSTTPTTSPSTPTSASLHTHTFLYSEEGEFLTTTNLRLTVHRKYIYQLEQPNPIRRPDPNANKELKPYISVHFFDEEKPAAGKDAIGGVFVEMGDLVKNLDGGWDAGNQERHLCDRDLYTASWKFGGGMVKGGLDAEEGMREGEKEVWWEVYYDVKGPKKDYVSETRYRKELEGE
ncbi:uncharacterized protein BDR25DRAFT_332277 [Lindgomyces ingoldianus]|uniref:Uncharacterized protein n=1 Tax=Lindgomyces ingoldianus TaxID=673940 RepID=A0ACB6R4T0_9PLEO|nr:uncharacterized protein BDR25DRAFT_332277 [Lindgomyces ingoldianus]KAF2474077.1 hypothetical protein BDR25DRAFT_332277 [Lindgomyces ingoldianus]